MLNEKGFLLGFMWGEQFLLEMEEFHNFWGYRPALFHPYIKCTFKKERSKQEYSKTRSIS